MTALTVKQFDQKLLVVGPIYDQVHKLSDHPDWFSDHIVVFNGNLCYPNHDLDQVRQRIETVERYLATGKAIYNLGSEDLLLMKKLWESGEAPDLHQWLRGKSNVILANFISQTNLIITGGGLVPNMSRHDLYDNLETSFVSRVGGRPWHELYGGGAGYVIANNPLTQNKPVRYNYSIQIGNTYQPDCKVYAIQVNAKGLGQIFSL